MSKILTITLPDDLEQALNQQAKTLNQSPEEIVLQAISQVIQQAIAKPETKELSEDPLLQLIGCLKTNIPDLAEKHDDYIQVSLYQELNNNE